MIEQTLSIAKVSQLKKPTKRKKRNTKVFLIILVLIVSSILTIQISSILVLDFLKERSRAIPDVESLISEVPYASEIYDRKGESLFRLHNDFSNSDRVFFNEINSYTIAAFLAAEDSTFFIHDGYRADAIVRCSIKTVSTDQKCGGSTITQQIVKILTKKNDPTISRKVEEIFTASRIDKDFPKESLMELYFNITPYGSNIIGIKTAADFYFGKNVSDLSFSESIVLSAIVNDPVQLSPTISSNNELSLQLLEERKEYVYTQLLQKHSIINAQLQLLGYKDENLITPEKIISAYKEQVNYKSPKLEIKSGHFVNYVVEQLQKRNYKNGLEPFALDDLQTGGYKIYTTLDYELQRKAEEYTLNASINNEKYNAYNAALMTIIPKTGDIITMSGSRSFEGGNIGCDEKGNNCKYNPEVNILTSLQSPGSTNKPLGYYIAYSKSLLAPGSFLPDIPISFGDYIPKNWDSKFLGTYNAYAERMLRESRNIPALIIMHMIGVEEYIETSKAFGYTTYNDVQNYGISLILGGGDIYPIEHAGAYSVFANGGEYVEIDPILKIEDSEGKIIYEKEPNPKKIADTEAVYLLNQSLKNLDVGTGDRIAWDDRDISGKTGTTQENKDSFLIVYSPDFVTLGWAGNNNNEPMSQLYGWPAFTIAPWLKNYMKEIDSSSSYFQTKTPFEKPENVYYGGGITNCSGSCIGIRENWLIKEREPSNQDIVRRQSINSETSEVQVHYIYQFPDEKVKEAIWQYFGGN